MPLRADPSSGSQGRGILEQSEDEPEGGGSHDGDGSDHSGSDTRSSSSGGCSQDEIFSPPPSMGPSRAHSVPNTPQMPRLPVKDRSGLEEPESAMPPTPRVPPALFPEGTAEDPLPSGSQVESGMSFPRPCRLINAVRSTDRPSQPLHLCGDAYTQNCDLSPTDHPTPNPPTPTDYDTPACRRLITHDFSPQDVVPLIGAVLTSRDELQLVSDLRRDDAQTFIDVIHKVRLHTSSFLGYSLITFVPFGCLPFELTPPTD